MASLLEAAINQHLLGTITLIAEYYGWRRENGRDRKCFTYQGLMNWYQKVRRGRQHWHTVERKIRRLAQLGYLTRIPKGKIMIFCPTPRFWAVVHQHQHYLQQQKQLEVSRGA